MRGDARRFFVSVFILAAASAGMLRAVPVGADPVPGSIQTFPPGETSLWGGGGVPTNPGTGGVDGVGDGFLRVTNPVHGHLGTRNESEFVIGDWLAAGVDQVRFYLNDVDANQNLEIHFLIGNTSNFWQYNVGFTPPEHSWAEFTVNLSDSSAFTHTINFMGESFAGALQNVDRILIRHDLPPFVQSPNPLVGEFGIDNILLGNPLVDVPPPGARVARPVMLAPPSPNPSRGAVALSLETFDPGEVSIRIVDARGRVVRTATLASAPAGPRVWMWDGLDESGRRTAPGVYRVHARGASGGTSRPVVRVQ